jgi:thiol:disulfide interchange protein DsbG
MFTSLLHRGALMAAALAFVGTSFAQTSGEVPAALQLAVTGGMKIQKRFEGPSGLTGWVVAPTRGVDSTIVYTTSDGKTLVVGTLFDATGTNLTVADRDAHAPKVDYAQFWQRVESSAYIAEGAQGKDVKAVLYAFLDPNCIYCHLAWKALRSYEQAGVQVRWIAVGFLQASSMGKSAAILEAADPAKALAEHETNYGPGKSGIAPVTPKPETRAKIQSNEALMQEMGITGTPGFVWKDAAGKVKVKVGMPRLAEFAEMTGLPEQNVTDPDLQRFR